MAKAKSRIKVAKKKVAETAQVIQTSIQIGSRVKVIDGSYYLPEETLEGMVGTVTHIDSFLHNKKSFAKVVLDNYDFGDDYSYFAFTELELITGEDIVKDVYEAEVGKGRVGIVEPV